MRLKIRINKEYECAWLLRDNTSTAQSIQLLYANEAVPSFHKKSRASYLIDFPKPVGIIATKSTRLVTEGTSGALLRQRKGGVMLIETKQCTHERARTVTRLLRHRGESKNGVKDAETKQLRHNTETT